MSIGQFAIIKLVMFMNRLRELRKERGFTQIKMQMLTGIDQSDYSKLETGKRYYTFEQLKKLADLCLEMNYEMKVLIDVNMGMNRTGVSIDDMEKLYRYGNSLEGILVDGLHCYDGNHNNKDIHQRMEDVKETDDKRSDWKSPNRWDTL